MALAPRTKSEVTSDPIPWRYCLEDCQQDVRFVKNFGVRNTAITRVLLKMIVMALFNVLHGGEIIVSRTQNRNTIARRRRCEQS